MTSTANKRLRMAIASFVALAAAATFAAFAGSASAGFPPLVPRIGFDPEDTDIPYLAWRGEQVRLVKCVDPSIFGDGADAQVQEFGVGTFVIEDWSGDPHQRPQFEDHFLGEATAFRFAGTGEEAGMACWATDIVSLKAGLAIVKLTVSGDAGAQPLLKHQFLVAWMNISSANVTDIGPTTMPLAVPSEDALFFSLAGQASLATTQASVNQVQVLVQGTIPMEGNFDELNAQLGRAAGTPLTMPTDWAALAGVMARSAIPGHERDPLLWDIHDQFTGAPGGVGPPATDAHQAGGDCPGSSTTMDEVDNCLGTEGPVFLG